MLQPNASSSKMVVSVRLTEGFDMAIVSAIVICGSMDVKEVVDIHGGGPPCWTTTYIHMS
jgi:hypothetical protein